MKAIPIFLLLTTASLGLVCVIQFQKIRQQQILLAASQNNTAQLFEQIQELKEAQQRGAEQRKLLLSQSEELAAQLQTQENVATQAVAPVSLAAAPAAADTNDNPLGG